MSNKVGRPFAGYTSMPKRVPVPIYTDISKLIEGWKVDNKKLGEQAAVDKLRDKLESE